MLASDFSSLFVTLPPLLVALLIVHVARNYFNRGLNKYPGPILAACTDWWRFFAVARGDVQVTQRKLHSRYGDIVRLGPNVLSFAHPDALNSIYSGKKGFRKSDFYPVQQTVRAGKRVPTIFTTTDEALHSNLRRGASNAYALTTLLQFEPFVDSTTLVFLRQLDERFADRDGAEGECDFSLWLQYYAFDVICELTYSKRMGFLETGEDVGNLISTLEAMLNYSGPVGQQPKLDLVFKKNPVKLLLGRLGFLNSTMPQVKFAQQRFAERMQEMGPASSQETKPKPGGPRDFLTRFLEAKKSHADVIGDPQVLSLTMTNLVAGSDTTAISLRTIFYYLLKTPECYRKLMQQISGGEKDGLFADTKDGLVSWAEAQKLTYLDAVVKEGLRIFPAVGFCLERVVPAQGAEICGETIPGGCIVGCNAWVIHRREEIYGEDVGVFRPERWLEADEERLAMMKRYMFSFGMGSHTCIGKNVSYLEMYKVVPAILRRFTLELVDPEEEWTTHNAWFVKQQMPAVRFRRRKIN